jgi:hypothetical protein
MVQRRCVNDVVFEGCVNGTVRGGVCVTHGAKVKMKQCSHEGYVPI